MPHRLSQGPSSPAATLSEQRAELADRALATLWAVWPWGGGTAGPGRECGTSEPRGRKLLGRLGEASKVPFPSNCPESGLCGSQVGSETKSHAGEVQAMGCRHTRARSLEARELGLLIQNPDLCPRGLA